MAFPSHRHRLHLSYSVFQALPQPPQKSEHAELKLLLRLLRKQPAPNDHSQ